MHYNISIRRFEAVAAARVSGLEETSQFIIFLFLPLDSMIILWKLNNSPDQNTNEIFMETDDVQNKESWTFQKALR